MFFKGLAKLDRMRNSTPKWILVVAARPNLMKAAPLIRAVKKHNKSSEDSQSAINHMLVHTGQHYDVNMSDSFFEDLSLPEPDVHLGVGSGTHGEQTGKVLLEFEKVLFREQPDLVVVVGDVNSTLACALAAAKLNMPVAHVEAGLRSFDRTMPEEINRLLTDAISDYLFTPSPDADDNLKREGIPEDKIFLVGDVMVDSLLFHVEKAKETDILQKLGLTNIPSDVANPTNARNSICPYALLTLHRPSNVDDKHSFLKIIKALTEIAKHVPVIFPVHPRTRKQIEAFGFEHHFTSLTPHALCPGPLECGIHLLNPLGYLDFLNLMAHAKVVLTDSGGIQEETTALNISCITLRNTTERPITLTHGTNVLVWNDTQKIIDETFKVLDGKGKKGHCPKLWDGRASDRIVKVLAEKATGKPRSRTK